MMMLRAAKSRLRKPLKPKGDGSQSAWMIILKICRLSDDIISEVLQPRRYRAKRFPGFLSYSLRAFGYRTIWQAPGGFASRLW
jgi:hypothetical protein